MTAAYILISLLICWLVLFYLFQKILWNSYAFDHLKAAELKLAGGDTLAFWQGIRVASRFNYDLVEAAVARGRIELRAARDCTLNKEEKEDMLNRFREAREYCSSDRRWGNKAIRDNSKNIFFIMFFAVLVARVLALIG